MRKIIVHGHSTLHGIQSNYAIVAKNHGNKTNSEGFKGLDAINIVEGV